MQTVLFDASEVNPTLAETRQRRALTRRALMAAQAQIRREFMQRLIDQAHDSAATFSQMERDADTAIQVTDDGFHLAAGVLHRAGSDEVCPACTAFRRYQGARATAALWEQRLAGFEPFHRYMPSEVRTWVQHPTAKVPAHVLVDDDERLPDFTEIPRDSLDRKVLERLDSIVSFMPNWCWEPAGVSEAQVITRKRKGRPVSVETKPPKENRVYPGFHHIGVERERTDRSKPGSGAWSCRIGVITVWLERRNRWAVYVCYDGGRNHKGFTTWQPYEWHVVEPRHPEHLADVQHWTLDRALEVAYLKAKQVRVMDGEWTESEAALPFDPAQLSVIADAQATEQERRRRGTSDEE